MKRLFSLLEKNKKFFLFTLLVGLLYSAIGVVIPNISGQLITAAISRSDALAGTLGVFLALSFCQILFAELDEYAGNTLKLRQKAQMRKHAFRAFSVRDDAGTEEISSFVSFVNNDIPSVTEQYVLGTVDILKCMSMILLSALSLLYIHWLFALVIVSISVLIVLLPNTMRKRGGEAGKQYSARLARYNTTLRSILDGLHIVKAYRAQTYARTSTDAADDGVSDGARVLLKHHLIVQLITTALQVMKTVLLLLVGVALLARERIEVGSIVAVLQLSEIMGAPIEVLAYERHERNEVLPLLAQYETLIAYKDETADLRAQQAGAFQELSVEHVSCQAGELAILTDTCARFEAGKNYLITGESGSGKSTLLRLIAQIGTLRYAGKIFYNRQEIKTLTDASYYEKVCPVFQEPYLFHATLEENICLGRDIPKETYLSVIENLNLGYLLRRHHNQELTPEIIQTLSGGERQRVALARAMVGHPSVYLLDEVTSALDQENAELVERLLLQQDAAVLHVCHKPTPALLDRYDAVFRMTDGKLVSLS